MPELPFDVVDVFTDRPYAGNPLAVVHGAAEAGLTAAQMQAIAAEFRLSETVFTLPPTEPGADYRVRIFTPAVELPFAGHPSVGAAWVLARAGVIGTGEVVQECGAGLLPVQVDEAGARVAGGLPSPGPNAAGDELAEAVGLTADDLDVRARAGAASAGVPYVVLPVLPGAVARAVCDAKEVAAITAGTVGLVVASVGDAPVRHVHMRMFAPGSGVVEDPATGSAAVALAVFLVARGLLPGDGASAFTIDQGAEIGRPSRLDVTVEAAAGRAVSTTVGGGVAAVSSGVLTALP
ncbi:PhzF family phenazine biosynthesis protein [Pseudonocardia sp. N23]|uniref:PhzF family phenazine biosynthesis protein n=1 Tax=Pseudonocardia sp. N23 TaxID=1987376 RepID=UPI000BFC72BC|nr:PhzF family phenazine biosynthesis protein [Pseudonocardia sp. N23]GAY13237.1 phenazine biosynthesis protein PhzF like [Pseudonocardia sp. N23]